jgi:hypothetical protein
VSDRLYTEAEVAQLQQSEVQLILKSLLRNLTEVRNQQSRGTGQGAAHRNGVVDGLNIAIAAVRRRVR